MSEEGSHSTLTLFTFGYLLEWSKFCILSYASFFADPEEKAQQLNNFPRPRSWD